VTGSGSALGHEPNIGDIAWFTTAEETTATPRKQKTKACMTMSITIRQFSATSVPLRENISRRGAQDAGARQGQR